MRKQRLSAESRRDGETGSRSGEYRRNGVWVYAGYEQDMALDFRKHPGVGVDRSVSPIRVMMNQGPKTCGRIRDLSGTLYQWWAMLAIALLKTPRSDLSEMG